MDSLPGADTLPTRGRHTLEESVYSHVRSMILAGQLEPGQAVIQEDLAAALGVSRTPLRRALGELASENLLERSNKGTYFVRCFSQEEILVSFEIRAVLEGLVCRLLAPVVERADIAYLRALFPERDSFASEDDWLHAYRDANTRFHTKLLDLGETMLGRLLNSYMIMTVVFVQGLVRPPSETALEHARILDCLEAGDPDGAEEAMRQHVRRSIAALRAQAAEDDLGC